MRQLPTLSALGLALVLVACTGENTGPSVDASLDADVAAVAGSSAAEDAGAMQNPGLAGSLTLGAEFRLADCSYDGSSGRYECPSETVGGLLYTRSYAFLTAGGQPMAAFDALLTASANVQSSLSGTTSRGSWSAVIDWSRDFTVSGLAGSETSWTWNGSGTAQVESTHNMNGNGATRQYHMTMVTTVSDVVVPYPRTAGSYPTSGSMTKSVTITHVGGTHDGQTATRTATITFDGSQTAHLTVGGRQFEVNLVTHVVTEQQ